MYNSLILNIDIASIWLQNCLCLYLLSSNMLIPDQTLIVFENFCASTFIPDRAFIPVLRVICQKFPWNILRVQINVRVQMIVRGGNFWKNNKRTGPNKHTGGNLWKSNKCTGPNQSTGWKNLMNTPLMYCNYCKKEL